MEAKNQTFSMHPSPTRPFTFLPPLPPPPSSIYCPFRPTPPSSVYRASLLIHLSTALELILAAVRLPPSSSKKIENLSTIYDSTIIILRCQITNNNATSSQCTRLGRHWWPTGMVSISPACYSILVRCGPSYHVRGELRHDISHEISVLLGQHLD